MLPPLLYGVHNHYGKKRCASMLYGGCTRKVILLTHHILNNNALTFLLQIPRHLGLDFNHNVEKTIQKMTYRIHQ